MINYNSVACHLEPKLPEREALDDVKENGEPSPTVHAISDEVVIYKEPLLSPRESEIARLVAKGLPNKTIAAILDISPWTVATHLKRIFAKLGVRSRAAMVSVLGGYKSPNTITSN